MDSKPPKPKKPISEKTRAADERLREELRHADLEKFGKLLDKAIKPSTSR